jgi:hypothetical protein
VLYEVNMQRLGFAYDLSKCSLKNKGVDRRKNLDVFTDVVGRAGGRDLLRKPDTKLGARQWQCIVVLSASRCGLRYVIRNAIEGRRRIKNLIHGDTPLCAELRMRFPEILRLNKAVFGYTTTP